MAEIESGPNGERTVTISSKDALDVLRIQALEGQKDEILKWAKNRFWTVTIVSLIAGLFGGYGLIKSTIRELLDKEIESAKKEMGNASNEARRAADASSSVVRQAEVYKSEVETLQKKVKDVDGELLAVQQRIQAESSSARAFAAQELKVIGTRVTTLETLVTNLAKDSKDNAQLLAKYQAEIASVKAANEAISKRFAENSNYIAKVFSVEQTQKLSHEVWTKLSQAGFKTSLTSLKSSSDSPVMMKSNAIFYERDARQKAKEIQELLSPIVQIKETKETKMLSFTDAKVWSFGTFPLRFDTTEKTIAIYLVSEK